MSTIKEKLERQARGCFLALGNPDAVKYARWHDLFLLLIPIAGLVAFIGAIEGRYNVARYKDKL